MRISGCLLRGDVAESGVARPPIVVGFAVGERITPRGITVGIVALVHEFGFQGAEDALPWRVVAAVCGAAHRLSEDGCVPDLGLVAGGVLAAAIRMREQARSRRPPLDCPGQ